MVRVRLDVKLQVTVWKLSTTLATSACRWAAPTRNPSGSAPAPGKAGHLQETLRWTSKLVLLRRHLIVRVLNVNKGANGKRKTIAASNAGLANIDILFYLQCGLLGYTFPSQQLPGS